MTAALEERLQRLAAWADRFADGSFMPGTWVASTTRPDGVIQMGWYDLSDMGQSYVSEMYELGWVYAFDWSAWLGTAEGQRLSSGPGPIDSASSDDLARLLKAIIRGERFGDSQIEGAFRSGMLLAIARRAGELSDSLSGRQGGRR
ncbi:MAG: DUF6508 domain-containing protein [Candidatus Krumholzibacteriia bacterium]